jgi:hypothetical protein
MQLFRDRESGELAEAVQHMRHESVSSTPAQMVFCSVVQTDVTLNPGAHVEQVWQVLSTLRPYVPEQQFSHSGTKMSM